MRGQHSGEGEAHGVMGNSLPAPGIQQIKNITSAVGWVKAVKKVPTVLWPGVMGQLVWRLLF